jgi:type 1 glutamine amidotransferase
VLLNGDDVFEDLVTAGGVLQRIALDAGYATRVRYGMGAVVNDPDALAAATAFIMYTARGTFEPEQQHELSRLVSEGRGLVVVHAANVFGSIDGLLDERYRTAFDLVGSRYRSHGPEPRWSVVRVETDPGHPITRGIGAFELFHEHYELETAPDVETIAWREVPGGREPIVHVRRHGAGGVVYVQLGHDARTLGEPVFAELVARSLDWSAGR